MQQHNFVPNPDFEADPNYAFEQDPAPTTAPTDADEFSSEAAQDVLGLMFIGALSKEFDYMGHSFVIRTLRAGEELAVSQCVREYEETMGASKAYGISVVGACIETVDGRPLIAALGPDTLATTRQKFEYVRDKWYWPTIEAIYAEYSDLIVRQANAYSELEGKSKPGALTPSR